MTGENEKLRDTDDTAPLPQRHQVPAEPPGKFVNPADTERAMRQALTWCVVNDGETLADHPKLLKRFREILGMTPADWGESEVRATGIDLAGTVLDDSPLTEEEARELKDRGDTHG